MKHRFRLFDSSLGGVAVIGTVLASIIGITAYQKSSGDENGTGMPPKPEPGDNAAIAASKKAEKAQLTRATVVMTSIGHVVTLISRSAQMINFEVMSNMDMQLQKEWFPDASLV